MNTVTIIGDIGNTPTLRETASGQPVLNLLIAVDSQYGETETGRKERTDWIPIVVWGALGKHCSRFLTKGSRVGVEGRVQSRAVKNRDGTTTQMLEISARNIDFLRLKEIVPVVET